MSICFKLHLSGILLIFFFILSIRLPTNTFAFSGAGSGDNGSPFLITTCSQLQEISNDLSASYKLSQSIDCNSTSFNSIGTTGTPFTGTLNGQDYSISNLNITSSNPYSGLFTATDTGATIKNLKLIGGSITGTNYAASFVGSVQGETTISDSTSSMHITANGAGGIAAITQIGAYTLTIVRSSFTGNLTSPGSSYIGGIIAVTLTANTSVTDCYTSGNYAGVAYVGGLVGYGTSIDIRNCYSTASLTGNGSNDVGGLIGFFSSGTLTNSFSATHISGSSSHKGSVFGSAAGSFSTVYFDQSVTGIPVCAGADGATCNAINSDNSVPNYFKNNKINAPLNSWDFVTVWKQTNSFPLLVTDVVNNENENTDSNGESNHNSDSHTFSVTAPPGCSNQPPSSSPTLFQLNVQKYEATLYFSPASGLVDKYFVAYGFHPGDIQYGVEFPQQYSSGVISYTVRDLSPDTTYTFIIRAGNGCMPGDWGNSVTVKTLKKNSTKTKIFYK